MSTRYERRVQGPFPSADDAAPPTQGSSCEPPQYSRENCEACEVVTAQLTRYGCASGSAVVGAGACLSFKGTLADLTGCEPVSGVVYAAYCLLGQTDTEELCYDLFCRSEELTGEELVEEARRAALTDDMRNVGPGEAWSAGMQIGPVSEVSKDGTDGDACVTFVCHDPQAGCASRWEGEDIVVAFGSTAIKAIRYKYSNGNTEKIAISYLLSNNRLYHYYEWSQPKEDGIKTDAGRWRPDDQTPSVFRRTNFSHNGRPGKQKPTTMQRQATVTQQYEDCPDGDSTECGCCSSNTLENRYFPTIDVQTLDSNECAAPKPEFSVEGAAGTLCKGLCGAYLKSTAASLCGLVGCMGSQCVDSYESCAECLSDEPPVG